MANHDQPTLLPVTINPPGETPRHLALGFGPHDVFAIEYEGRPVLIAQHLGRALGYAQPGKLAWNIQSAWANEFVEGKDFIKLTNGKLAAFKAMLSNCLPNREAVDRHTRNLLLLTESGASLAASLARTPVGVAFRRWIADELLPKWRELTQPPVLEAVAVPVPAPKVTALARRGERERELRRAKIYEGSELRLRHALDGLTAYGLKLDPRSQEHLAIELGRMVESGNDLVDAGHNEAVRLMRQLVGALSTREISTFIQSATALEMQDPCEVRLARARSEAGQADAAQIAYWKTRAEKAEAKLFAS
jgi:prophage antirepressor-like protein